MIMPAYSLLAAPGCCIPYGSHRRAGVWLLLAWLLWRRVHGGAQAACPGDFAIAIDIGHSLEQPGAISARGKPEYDFNRRLGLALYEMLRAQGYRRAYLLDPPGTLGGAEGLHRRTTLANAHPTDLLISLHHDSVQAIYLRSWRPDGTSRTYSDHARGYSLFYDDTSAWAQPSLRFAQRLGAALRRQGLRASWHHAEPIAGENRRLIDAELGIYAADFWMLRQTHAPAVLLEAGVIVNREEESRLEQPAYRARILQALSEAIAGFCIDQERDEARLDAEGRKR
jgi:N-acetylmuramoyl-L-alanine amidase